MNLSERELEQLRSKRGVYGILQTRLPDGMPWLVYVMDDSSQDDLEALVAGVVDMYIDNIISLMHSINVNRRAQGCRRFIHSRGLVRYRMIKELTFGIWFAVELGGIDPDVWKQAENAVRAEWEDLPDNELIRKRQEIYAEMADDEFLQREHGCEEEEQ